MSRVTKDGSNKHTVLNAGLTLIPLDQLNSPEIVFGIHDMCRFQEIILRYSSGSWTTQKVQQERNFGFPALVQILRRKLLRKSFLSVECECRRIFLPTTDFSQTFVVHVTYNIKYY